VGWWGCVREPFPVFELIANLPAFAIPTRLWNASRILSSLNENIRMWHKDCEPDGDYQLGESLPIIPCLAQETPLCGCRALAAAADPPIWLATTDFSLHLETRNSIPIFGFYTYGTFVPHPPIRTPFKCRRSFD
jgi:hypothetical protein